MRTLGLLVSAMTIAVALVGSPRWATAWGDDPPRNQAKPVDRNAWAQKLATLKDGDWRSAFEVGSELADLPPDDGFAILKENWPKLKVESRQQMLKAWYYTLPYPLHARNHARIRDVLDLGARDRSPQVQQWAAQFLRELPKAGKSAKPDESPPDDSQPDEADVPAVDLRVGGDAKKRYFLIGAADKAPRDGYALLVVLPGGDGSEEFSPFVRNIYHNALSQRWLIAQVVAPKWDDNQFDQIVWPTAGLPYAAAKFTTEELVEAIVSDVKANVKIDPKRVFMLGWSSGGPPCYAAALRADTPVTGALVAMSIFKPQQMPPLQQAQGKAFYLLQSPDDRVAPIRFAETAEKTLRTAGAKVRLQRYKGGHGWQGNVWKMIGDGTAWLDKQAGLQGR
jgi:predicted esterase